MTREKLTQEQQKPTDEASTPEMLRAQLVTEGSELTEDQLDEVVGGVGMGWDDGKVRCSCGSTDVEELEPEEIDTTPPAKEDNPESKTLEEITGNDAYYPLPTPEVGDMPPPAPPTSNEIIDSANNEDNNAEPST